MVPALSLSPCLYGVTCDIVVITPSSFRERESTIFHYHILLDESMTTVSFQTNNIF